MEIILLSILGLSLIIVLCVITFISLNGWINKNKPKSKPYTKITLILAVISLGGTLIMAFSLILNTSFIGIQAKAIAPIDPDLRVERVNAPHNKFFFDSHLVQLNHLKDWTFWLQTESIDFAVVNRGQRETGDIHFYLIDQEKKFRKNGKSVELSPLGSDYFSLDLIPRECHNGKGKNEFDQTIIDGCNEDEFKGGLKKLILEVDCKKCLFEENPRCYSFNICIYNQTLQEEWCVENFHKEDFKLDEIKCPKEIY